MTELHFLGEWSFYEQLFSQHAISGTLQGVSEVKSRVFQNHENVNVKCVGQRLRNKHSQEYVLTFLGLTFFTQYINHVFLGGGFGWSIWVKCANAKIL